MINPHDPFGRIGKKGSNDAGHGPKPENTGAQSEMEAGAEEPKQKRKYTRRIPPKTSPQFPVDKPEAQEPELVAAIFTTGELTIYVGDEILHLTTRQREKLEQFLGIMTPRAEATRPRRKCVICHQRRDLDKFEGDKNICKDCDQ
jgi:hypothetical protein